MRSCRLTKRNRIFLSFIVWINYMTEKRDTTNPKYRRGVGPNGPAGPGAEIQSAKATVDRTLKFPLAGGFPPKVSRMGHMQSKYRLSVGVQVRDENFGLLFYNYRGPRLYFVPSKDIIDAEFFNGRQSVSSLIDSITTRRGWPWTETEKRIRMILSKLAEKGLIYEQSIR